MTMWKNNDALWVKFGRDEAVKAVGGEVQVYGNRHVIEFTIDYTDALSATAAVLNGPATGGDGFGVVVPKGATPVTLDLEVITPFTSSGTIGSATLVIGTKKASDRSTDLNADAFTTTSFVLGVLDAAGESVTIKPGATGAGDGYGVVTSENGVLAIANSAHASHPLTAGKAKGRLTYVYN